MSPETTAAIIGAGGTVLAAICGVWTWKLTALQSERLERKQRAEERTQEEWRRHQRVLDLVVAIHSEILAGLWAAGEQLSAQEAQYALEQETPFATADDTDFVFEATVNDISILPETVIHSVVQYYRIARQSNLMTDDLRTEAFQQQSRQEKRKFLATLLSVVEVQKFWGEEALIDLEAFACEHDIDLVARRNRADAVFERAQKSLKPLFTQSDE